MSQGSDVDAAARLRDWRPRARRLVPGLLVALIVALAATFVSEHYGGPKFLYALLMGMALHFLSEDARCGPGIEFAARQLVRLGVALLGARIAFGDVLALGSSGVAWLAASRQLARKSDQPVRCLFWGESLMATSWFVADRA